MSEANTALATFKAKEKELKKIISEPTFNQALYALQVMAFAETMNPSKKESHTENEAV